MRHQTGSASMRYRQIGMTIPELLITTVIGALLVAGLNEIVGTAINAKLVVKEQTERLRDANFAMNRMVHMISRSSMLVLPYPDNPATNWPEHIREETVPASAPIGDSVKASAVLSLALPRYVDLNFDGFPDVDNDKDGRIDEDMGTDMTNDGAAGIKGVDDSGDGYFDDGNWWDDDEASDAGDEDPIDGVDNDGDGLIDEDSPGDMDANTLPGSSGVDEDGDGLVDEGSELDDDEDGVADEDWLDTVTYFLQGSTLMERMPVPWDVSGDAAVSGIDYIGLPIASGLTLLRFERVEGAGGVLVDIKIEVSSETGETVSLQRRVRVGGVL